MFSKLRSLFSPESPAPRAPEPQAEYRVPAGRRVYAIGDIHGRLDLFEQVLALIDEDDARRGPAETTLVLLGDLIDRGPDSRGVVERAMELAQTGRVRILAGNHEEMLLDSFGNEEVLRHFLRHGGKETLFSYGLAMEDYAKSNLPDLQERLPTLVPQSHLDFMRRMENQVVVGDYLFVHAGIRPGVPLTEQAVSDMRWIRRDFLDFAEDHGCMVVHGHTITDEPALLHNRIGIDTGAFASGRLTALGIEGAERWILSANIDRQANDTN